MDWKQGVDRTVKEAPGAWPGAPGRQRPHGEDKGRRRFRGQPEEFIFQLVESECLRDVHRDVLSRWMVTWDHWSSGRCWDAGINMGSAQ